MGLPLSSYNIMRALSSFKFDGSLMNSHNIEKNFVIEELSSFSLFAFILFDPEIHPEFGNHLNSSFDDLDYITGHKLLFFALVDPPTNWSSTTQNRGYVKNQIFGQENILKSKDNSIAAHLIAKSLNISIKDSAQLIISKDFKLNKFISLPTNEIVIDDQLKNLGKISDRREKEIKYIGIEKLFKLISDELGYKNYILISQDNSLADSLTNILCFIRGDKIGDREDMFAEFQINKILRDIKKNIFYLKKIINKNNNEEMILDNYFEELVEKEYLLYCKKPVIVEEFEHHFLEIKSNQFLKTAISLSDFYNKHFYLKNQNSFDFSPLVIQLAKVFENEINLSIVHEIRKILGIKMPEFFNKYQKSTPAIFVPKKIENGREVNFNMKSKKKWLPPGIGQSELVANEIFNSDFIYNSFGNENWNLLMNSWKIIRKERNKGSHINILNIESFNIVYKEIINLNSSGIFKNLFNIKKSLRINSL